MLSVSVRRAENLQRMRQKGPFRPFVIAWVDKKNKFKTEIDENGDTNPVWNTTLPIPLVSPIDDDTTLKIVIYDACNDGNQKRIGSAELKLQEVKNDVESRERTLTLKRRSFRSRGHIVVKVLIDENPAGTDKRDKQDENPADKDKQDKKRRRDRVKKYAKRSLRLAGVALSLVGIVQNAGG